MGLIKINYKNKLKFISIFSFLVIPFFRINDINYNSFESSSILLTDNHNNLATSDSEKPVQFDYLDIGNSLTHYKGDSIKVAIIDSGIDIDNKEFKISDKSATLKTTYNTSGVATNITWYTYDRYPSYLDDTYGHGTNVASILASQINNYNYMGIAPNVELIVLKVTNDSNGYDWYNISGAFQYILSDSGLKGDVDIINMSFQGYKNSFTYNGTSITGVGTSPSSLLQPYINQCYKKGITMVASAGNYNQDISKNPCYPASLSHVISVGALEKGSMTNKASYSNYGKIDIVTTGYCQYTSINEEVKQGQGTSYSAPIISGAIALFLQKYQDSSYLASLSGSYMHDKVLTALSTSAVNLNDTSNFGYGRLSISSLLGEDKLDAPTLNFNPINRILSWNEVIGADSFALSFIDPNFEFYEYNLNSTQFDFSNYPLGEYEVELTAKGEGYTDSNAVSFSFETSKDSDVNAYLTLLKEYNGKTCASTWTNRDDIVELVSLYNGLSNDSKSSSLFLETYNDNGYQTSYINKLMTMVSQYNDTLKKGETELFLVLSDGTIFNAFNNNNHIEILNETTNNSIVIILISSIVVALATATSSIYIRKKK